MRKSLWIMLAVLLVVIAAPAVHADSVYEILFNGPGSPTIVGSNLLEFDTTLNQFTTPSLTVDYQGLDIILMNRNLGPIDPTSDEGTWQADNFKGATSFDIFDSGRLGGLLFSGQIASNAPLGVFVIGFVDFIVPPTPTPEPSSVALMLLGGRLSVCAAET